MEPDYPAVQLRPGRDYSLRQGHPWLFSGAFRDLPRDIPAGAVVDILTSGGEWLARGHLNARNSLAFRVLTLDRHERIDEDFYVRRIQRALALRALLPATIDAYRLVHAEADYLPGVIVDRYDRWLVAQLHTAGAEADRSTLVAALERVVAPDGILVRDDLRVREREGLAAGAPSVAAGSVPETITIDENGVRYLVDPWHGQKTGFFLDQREKRMALRELARHASSLLNCFSYSGSFALAALAGNSALHTINVDSSEPALDLARRNYALNGHAPDAHEFAPAEVNHYVQQVAREGRAFDIVILDPPAFAKNLASKERALRGYEALNASAARVVAPGGLLLTCSCSGAVSVDEFEAVVGQGLLRAQRQAQLLASFGPSIDHPTLPGFVEDRYLKAFVYRLV
jgi:23S rRNA (cytosine1962-C5)-methyltransferase